MDISYDDKDILAKIPLTVDGKEDEVINDLINRDIATVLADYGYPIMKLRTVFEGKKCTIHEQFRLNYVIKRMYKIDKIPVKDIILFFDSFAPIEKILYYINDDVKAITRKEYSYVFRRGKNKKSKNCIKKKTVRVMNNSFIKRKTRNVSDLK